MKILVTGAEGSLASALIPILIEKGYEVIVSDTSDTHWNTTNSNTNPDKHKPTYLTDLVHIIPDDVTYKIRRKEVDCIIHCAEDAIPSLDTRIIYTNIYYSAEIFKACAETGIRCIVPTWKEINYNIYHNINDILWKSSIRYKANLVKFYNIGNAVINLINIPRIILNDMHPNIYGNLFCRFFDCMWNGKLFITYNNEFGLNEYTGIDSVIDVILNNISMKTRHSFNVEGYYIEDIDLISYLLYIFDLPCIEIYPEKHNPRTIMRPENEPDNLFICDDLKKIILNQLGDK